ncbi:MAG TPA: hypothetical protein DDY43_09580 [Synechococcales bacterium UBA10510]|nr:hypothetical protein [Synechococcales bacterium UBA10510]
MTATTSTTIRQLGQTGLRIDIGEDCFLFDPYLSNSVQELDAPDLRRQIPIPFVPEQVTNAKWVVITHEHLDHCDPHTLPQIAAASPGAKFMAPEPARKLMQSWGIEANRIVASTPDSQQLAESLSVKSLPSAHPKVRMGNDKQPVAVGYLISLNDCQIYLAGDTSACEDVIEVVKKQSHIDIGLLPVNEDNFFRRKRGIIGNMSIREAFGLAAECGISTVVPVHWDLFEANSTDPEEIKAVYQAYAWPFRLAMSIEEALT